MCHQIGTIKKVHLQNGERIAQMEKKVNSQVANMIKKDERIKTLEEEKGSLQNELRKVKEEKFSHEAENIALKRDLKTAREEANFTRKTFEEEAAATKKTYKSRVMEMQVEKQKSDDLLKAQSAENYNLSQELEETRKGMQEQRKVFKQQLLLKNSEKKALSDELEKSRGDINKMHEEKVAYESQSRRNFNDQFHMIQRLKTEVERTKREALAAEADLSSKLQNKNDKIVRMNRELDDFDGVKRQRVRTLC